ncbi:MAG: LysM peptidoglycan-binding domain-containing protein [Lachnospiraceae bacterium]|nr:LysM peptidoglycan-binding domain-containing protein [Lachnospiraceae bacterium]
MTRRQRIQAKRRLRNLTIILLMILAFCSGFFGHTLLSAYAKEKSVRPRNRYYTSVQLRQGDSLWEIARKYSEGSGYSVDEYVEELKRMNGLKGEAIHSGEYLTVVYFAE